VDGPQASGRRLPKERGCRWGSAGEDGGIDRLGPVFQLDDTFSDMGHLGSGADTVAEGTREGVDQLPHPPSGPEEQRTGISVARRPLRGLRATDQAPLGPLPRHELGERRRRRQAVDVAGVEAREERGDRSIGGLVPEPAAEQLTEGLLYAVSTLPLHEIRECPDPPARGQARPSEHVSDVAGDPEPGTGEVRHQPGVRPEESTRGSGGDEAQSEIATERRARRLPGRERVGTRLEQQASHLDGGRDHPAMGARAFEHDGIRSRPLQMEGGGESRDACADDGDSDGHASG
jgi:hypothetical protein